ncbi:MAG: prepilin-type N-terminal cleavage/methylation domain-containing protein [Phycisphaerales bacterium]|nr:prepilin-type N-terminal cleavage/methylation domain-containing protein [Phycisphaerales bacterium]
MSQPAQQRRQSPQREVRREARAPRREAAHPSTQRRSGVTGRCNPGDRRRRARVRAFTLIELLITVAVLGLAGALVIPAMTSTGVLRVQSAVRTLVADMTYAQGDAMAFQARRAIWFGKVPRRVNGNWTVVDGNGYVVAEVNGAELNLDTDVMFDPSDPSRPLGRDFDDDNYGGATITNVNFNDDVLLIFDEVGGPVAELDGPDPGNGGSLQVQGMDSTFIVTVLPFTGRITVQRTED